MAFCDNKRGIISEAKPTRIAQSEAFFLKITQNMKMAFLGYFKSTNSSCITKRNNAMMSKPKTCWVKKLVSKKEKRQIIIIKLFCVPQVIFFFVSCESFVYTHVSFFVVEIFFGEEKTSF